MADMSTEFVRQTQAAQQSQTAQKPAGKTENSEGQSFSETLEAAKNGAKQQPAQQAQVDSESGDQGAENGAMLMAEAMGVIPMSLVLPAVANGEAEEILAAAQSVEQGEILATAQLSVPEASQLLPQLQSAEQTANIQSAAGEAFRPEQQAVPTIEVTITTPSDGSQNGQNESGDPQSDMLKGQSEFQKSVEMAQKLIKADDNGLNRTRPLEIDVEELQRRVDSKEYLNAAQAQQSSQSEQPHRAEQASRAQQPQAQQLDSRDIFQQIKASADINRAEVDKEFVIRLKPEGLGEIVAKLVSQDGRMTLSLTANDLNVQRLLNSELNTLREAMRPYDVEVSQVEHSDEAAMADLQQQLQQQSRQQFGSNNGRRSGAHRQHIESVELPEEQQQQQPRPASALDAYI